MLSKISRSSGHPACKVYFYWTKSLTFQAGYAVPTTVTSSTSGVTKDRTLLVGNTSNSLPAAAAVLKPTTRTTPHNVFLSLSLSPPIFMASGGARLALRDEIQIRF